MSRTATIATSFGVGSLHVGIEHLTGREGRAIFQFASNSPFGAEIFATQDFDFNTNVGTNWIEVTGRTALGEADDIGEFVDIGGNLIFKKKKDGGVSIGVSGLYALDNGFMPAAFMVNVTSITSGSPVKILFGV